MAKRESKYIGYVLLYRSIQDNFIWKDKPFARGQAFIDLIMMANHADKKTIFNGHIVEVKRGERITSMRQLGDRWGWSRGKVKLFLDLLQSDGMISYKTDHKKTVYEVLNYSLYQDFKDDKLPVNDQSMTSELPLTDHRMTSELPLTDIRLTQTKNDINNERNNDRNNIMLHAEAFIQMPLNDKTFYSVPQDDVNKYQELYPAVDVEQQLRNMVGWLDANPQKLKTRNGIKRFITNWLSREQDKGGSSRIQSGGNNSSNSKDKIPDYSQDQSSLWFLEWCERKKKQSEVTDGDGQTN